MAPLRVISLEVVHVCVSRECYDALPSKVSTDWPIVHFLACDIQTPSPASRAVHKDDREDDTYAGP